LFSIARWYAETFQSLDVAATWYDGFLDLLDGLEADPLQGILAPENHLFDFELREVHYGSGRRFTHRALYRIVGQRIEILSVRHLSQQPLGPSELQ
jgi:Txe/YoeB family toxin of Txe-Axe toxin-antitoxin module